MNKLLYFFAFIIALYFLFLMGSGNFGADEAFIMIDSTSNTSGPLIPKKIIFEETEFKSLVVLDIEKINLEKILLDIDNIVILSDNIYNSGRKNFVLKDENPLVDSDLFARSEFAFFNNSFDEKIREKISLYSKINPVSISIKPNFTNDEIKKVSEIFKNYFSGKTLVISSIILSEIENKNLRKFHDDYSKHIIALLEAENLSRIDAKNLISTRAIIGISKELGLSINNISEDSLLFGKESVAIKSRPVYILALGDMMMGRYVRTLMDINGEDYPFENIRDENNRFFKGSDFVFANLEGPIKGNGFKSDSSMVFGFPEYVGPLLKKYGFNVLMIANNHALDQGQSGRDRTIEILDELEIAWCGNPRGANIDSVYFTEISGKTVSYVCFQDITIRLNQGEASRLVREASEKSDITIVSAHFGVEYKHTASDSLQVNPSREWIDNGADIVIGHHPHVVQNFEVYKGKIIFYSLGNFIFDQYWSKATQEQLGIGIEIDESQTRVFLLPMRSERSKPRLMTDAEKDEWVYRFIGYGNYSEEMKKAIIDGVIEIDSSN